MSVIKKIRNIGNSEGIPLPTDVLNILDINPEISKYYFRQDDNGRVFISVLPENIKKIEEKKFVKASTTWCTILPPTLIKLWDVKLGDSIEIKLNKENLSELEIKPIVHQ